MFGWPSYIEAKSKSGILSPSSSANRGAQNRLRVTIQVQFLSNENSYRFLNKSWLLVIEHYVRDLKSSSSTNCSTHSTCICNLAQIDSSGALLMFS